MDFVQSPAALRAAGELSPFPALPSATKRCGTCKEIKPKSEFSFKNKALGTLHTKCKACKNAYTKDHYAENRDEYLTRVSTRNKVVKQTYTDATDSYLAGRHCCRCLKDAGGELYLYRKPGYEGPPVHEVRREKLGNDAFALALANSDVYCRHCLGAKFVPNLLLYAFRPRASPLRPPAVPRARPAGACKN
ncbi:hypothetical protein F6X40_10365 [Paraburkholderia sp. UCT31]|uniref:hypothetical protein n=1 Tax=Paraburkholderia sp. UCT31 TaxID=2615209 RepID=UPI001656538A|nr:hypothetical protein [Paraburkholderia sp. UCT31]MBC8737211.1 hypothetical protein [Paraburkholderia sp. UCT31]